ncbi:hypothetical protein BGZ65_009740 [Modicella reniformis]|uniref:AAA+ ATPase domain-containing protein n=1 Tax=Modicella reniformis TaxID=1440133 RepID=A0A9P6JG94_9FUNG|nr:hypothetical protein BGZ65_009740 [Modicella reniformis]
MTMEDIDKSVIEAAAKECFMGKRTTASIALFIQALQKRNVVTRKNITRIIESTDYLALAHSNTVVVLTRNIFPPPPPTPPPPTPKASQNTAKAHVPPPPTKASQNTAGAGAPPPPRPTAVPLPAKNPARQAITTEIVRPVSLYCDTDAIADILDDIAIEDLDLEDTGITDIFIDVGSNASSKTNGECVQYNKAIEHSDISTILEKLPGGGPTVKQSNRVIFGTTLHRLAAVTYDGVITGVTIRVGRRVSGLLPLFEGFVERRNVLLCGAPNVGKTTTLREICKYLSRGKSIDELNTKDEVGVCQTIALRSIQMVASVHGNIQDLVFNPMLNKALGGSTQALVSDRNAVDGRKVVSQRTTRPIFDLVINIKRTPHGGLEYTFIDDVAENVSRIMQGKPIPTRTRRIVGDELTETKEEVLYPFE